MKAHNIKWLIRCCCKQLWLRLSCSDFNFTGYLEVTADVNSCPRSIFLFTSSLNYFLLLFLSVGDVFRCSE